MRMLFDYYDSKRLVICLDTASIDLIQDFVSDRARTQLLEIVCEFSDEYLTGHAQRVGLAAGDTTIETLTHLLPALKNDIAYESDRIGDSHFAGHILMHEDASEVEHTQALVQFLSVEEKVARDIAQTPHLFVD